jgi:hypothetical protein
MAKCAGLGLFTFLFLYALVGFTEIAQAQENDAQLDDKAFFSGAHLGMTIQDCLAYYHKLGNIATLWHSDAPAGERQVDFRTMTSPQRRVYVYYRKADDKIVSVSYWKPGSGG